MCKYFCRVSDVDSDNYINSWKSKGLPDENIMAPNTSDEKLNPELSFFVTKTKVEFNGSCLELDKIMYNHGKVVNIYIVYEILFGVDMSLSTNIDNGKKDKLILVKGLTQGL